MKSRRFFAGLFAAVAFIFVFVPTAAAAESHDWETTVLFTNDLQSSFLPRAAEGGGELGGYARLKTALDRERSKHPNALTLDGGDFSGGSLIRSLYTTQAAELRTMGALGYDAVTAGSDDFDYGGMGFAQMLNAAALSGDPTPALLMANYKPAQDNPDLLDLQRAMAAYGVQDCVLLERDGITYGIFGLMGTDAAALAAGSGFELGDAVSSARRCVDTLKGQGAQFIICLSHSGTNEKERLSEDEQLAKKVEGIDLIISGHTHTLLTQPLLVGDTYIVSAGACCGYLGSITLSCTQEGGRELVDYQLIPIDETLPEDQRIEDLVEGWKTQVSSGYLSKYNLTYDQILTFSGFDLRMPAAGVQEGNALGELAADAFRWAVAELAANAPESAAVAIVDGSALRASLYAGAVTTAQAFDVLSMGVGSDGTVGFPLVEIYLTGEELKAAAEADASILPVQLYMSGIAYSFNIHRVLFNRVTDIWMAEPDCFAGPTGQGQTPVENSQLYRVVTGLDVAKTLSTVKERSKGLLSVEPKMSDGDPVTDLEDCILYDKNGNELKEWYSLAAYLAAFGENGVSQCYAVEDGRKQVSRSWSPVQLMRNPNQVTLAVLLAVILAAALTVFLVRLAIRLRRRRRYGGGYLRRRRFGR